MIPSKKVPGQFQLSRSLLEDDKAAAVDKGGNDEQMIRIPSMKNQPDRKLTGTSL